MDIVSRSVTEPSWITPRLKYNIDFACIQIPMYINSFPLDLCFGSFERPIGVSHSMNLKNKKNNETLYVTQFYLFFVQLIIASFSFLFNNVFVLHHSRSSLTPNLNMHGFRMSNQKVYCSYSNKNSESALSP